MELINVDVFLFTTVITMVSGGLSLLLYLFVSDGPVWTTDESVVASQHERDD